MKNNTITTEDVFDAIEPALEANGFQILDGDRESVFITKDGKDFEIKVEELE